MTFYRLWRRFAVPQRRASENGTRTYHTRDQKEIYSTRNCTTIRIRLSGAKRINEISSYTQSTSHHNMCVDSKQKQFRCYKSILSFARCEIRVDRRSQTSTRNKSSPVGFIQNTFKSDKIQQ